MPRIRTVKPEFFTNFKLYKAESESKLPLRLAFEGLWCHSDREGRFKWIPEELKIGILPYDEVDFSRVLDALWTRGFIEKYDVESVFYGVIPSFSDHQVINNKERESILPIPNENNILTRDGRVTDARTTRDTRKGKERKGKEQGKKFIPPTIDEVITFFDDNGYTKEHAIKVFNYYSEGDWRDARGKPVQAWKQKMRGNWFKDEGKKSDQDSSPFDQAVKLAKEKNLEPFKGAPTETTEEFIERVNNAA